MGSTERVKRDKVVGTNTCYKQAYRQKYRLGCVVSNLYMPYFSYELNLNLTLLHPRVEYIELESGRKYSGVFPLPEKKIYSAYGWDPVDVTVLNALIEELTIDKGEVPGGVKLTGYIFTGGGEVGIN